MESIIPGCIAVGIQIMLAMSVNIVSGYARQLSLGQAAFAGLGAYASALLTVRAGLSFWLACPVSVLVTAGFGLALGLPVLRMMRYYLPVMTLGVNVLAQHLLRTGRLVGSSIGFGRITSPRLLGAEVQPMGYLCLVLVALGVCIAVDRWFWHSPRGRLLRGAAAPGPDGGPHAMQQAVLAAFGLSTAMAGLAGSLFAHFEAFISPFDFDLEASFFVLALAAVGGLGVLRGVLIGALLLAGVFEIFQFLLAYRLLLSGIIFLLVGLWFPHGFFAFPRLPRRKSQSTLWIQTVDRA
ncbi:MAG: branched-chain amino acid ABC transporter permease [Candidatus Tectomicrobia bacterium]